MGDYFAILAARANGAAESVRPLLAARYETLPAWPAGESPGLLEVEEQVLPPAVTSPGLAQGAQDSEVQGRPSREARISSPARQFTGKDDPAAGSVAEAPPAWKTPAPNAEQIHELHWDSARDVPKKSTSTDGEILPEAAGRHHRAAAPPLADDGSGQNERAGHREDRPPIEPTRLAASRTPPATQAVALRPQVPSVEPRSLSPAPAANEAATPAQAAPPIHISIGRIEVQAVFPPAASVPPPPRQNNPGALSLADYLGRRTSGRP